jgi:hypothetical protein
MAVESIVALMAALIEMAAAVVGLSDGRKGKEDPRAAFADLLVNIADCISAIADNIQAGRDSTERCAELKLYIEKLESLVAAQTDEETARKLTFWLKHVEAVPGYAQQNISIRIASEVKPKWSVWNRSEKAADVRQYAGLFRAFSNLVRASGGKA